MSPEQKSNWRPTAPLSHLQQRAELLRSLRAFFLERGVLEVETPLLCSTAASDPVLHPILVSDFRLGNRYLQTSPEYAMKRLLAAGYGSMYQISKAFRSDEVGRFHNPEFSMLEWYRVGFDHHQLMDEVDALLQKILGISAATRLTYQALFQEYLAICPHKVTLSELKHLAEQTGIHLVGNVHDLTVDDWLDLLMTHAIEPKLQKRGAIFIFDYPVSKAALAKVRSEDLRAERFEVYVQGIELANGYHELCDQMIQKERFLQDNIKRQKMGLSEIPIDFYLLDALEHGLPHCAGVALGVDRLLMLKLGVASIDEVIAFTTDRA